MERWLLRGVVAVLFVMLAVTVYFSWRDWERPRYQAWTMPNPLYRPAVDEKESPRPASPADLEELRRDWHVQTSRLNDMDRRQKQLQDDVWHLKVQQDARDKQVEAMERQMKELQKGKP